MVRCLSIARSRYRLGGWATLTGEYNAGLSFNLDRNNWGCAPFSRFSRKPARSEAERVGFHGRLAHGIFRASRPAFFITFFSYRPHRHRIAIVQEFTDSTASKTVPVSRDGPKIRRKTIFGGFFDNMQTSSKSGNPAPRKVHAKPQNHQPSPYSCR